MRVIVRVGALPVGHVFVTPLTRRLGRVAPLPPGLQVAFGEERATQEIIGVAVELGPGPLLIEHEQGVGRKALHPDVLVETAALEPEPPR